MHRNWGLAGIALFSIMMCSILVAEMAVLKAADALGSGDSARRFRCRVVAIVNVRK